MYFWNSYPFVRLAIALIVGIKLYDHFPGLWKHELIVGCIGVILLLSSILLANKIGFYRIRQVTGFLALTTIAYLGGFMVNQKYHSLPASHYTHLKGPITGFAGTIASPVNERTNHFRYDLKLEQITGDSPSKISGVIHLYVRKDSARMKLSYGDRILVYGSFYDVPVPGNPSEFDYRKYLSRQNIYAHAFVESSDIRISHKNPPNIFFNWAYSLRVKAYESIDRHIISQRENAVAKALLLGIKDHLDNDLKKAYSAAGAMHVLAVSGLHVGIIYLIIQLIFGKLKNQGTWGRRFFGVISVLLIWLYAVMTGLSPSVLRAATMFSLVAAGQANSKEGNIYNTLGFAAFILLCFDPYLIYSVGFQLSFIAVIGIVYLQPKLYRLLDIRWMILDKIWMITCVSIAAQLATFPLSAYYFHQFPTYFLASNLIVIPSAFLLLIGGIGMMVIDIISPTLASFVGLPIEKFLWAINESIAAIEQLPHSLVEWIFIDNEGLILTYGIILLLISALHFRSFKTLIIASFMGLVFIGWTLFSNLKQAKREQVIFYEIKGVTAIDHIKGHHATLYLDDFDPDNLELLSFQIDPFRLNAHLYPISNSIETLSTSFISKEALRIGKIGSLRTVIFDSTTFHLEFEPKIEVDVILIENGSVKNMNWLLNHFATQHIVLGNKNSSYYTRKMLEESKEAGINTHSLKESGALIIDIKKERTIQPALFTTNPD